VPNYTTGFGKNVTFHGKKAILHILDKACFRTLRIQSWNSEKYVQKCKIL